MDNWGDIPYKNVRVARGPSRTFNGKPKKRGRRAHCGHWRSRSLVMLGSWVLDLTPSQTRNPKP